MFCEYCGKELKEGSKYCEFCGAKVDFPEEKKETKPEETTKPKKKHKALKIVIIALIVLTFLNCAFWISMALIFRNQFDAFDNLIDKYKNGQIDDDDFYDDIEDYFDKYFDDYSFDYSNGDESFHFGKDNSGEITKSSYKGTDTFDSGVITESKNAYKSTFGSLEFSLPSAWEIGDSSKINKIYSEQGLSQSLYSKNLLVYDLVATNSFNGSVLYIVYYNADYYNESKGLDAFNDSIKTITGDYEDTGCKVEYADNSTVNVNGIEYNQLAARITTNNAVYYQYDFTRMVNDTYYMQISIFTDDIDTVGDVIDCLNNK